MNFSSPAFPGFAPAADPRPRRYRIAAGLAISLAVHALLLSAWRISHVRPRAEPELARSIAVWLRPPPPAVPRVAEPPPRAAPREPREPEAPRAQRKPRRVIAVPARPPVEPQADPFAVQPAAPDEPQPEAATPRFDPEAARKMARGLASIRDPAKVDTAIGQFPDKPLQTETREARAIAGTKRRNCKDGLPGGLLGPLLLLLDKKDSGCKW